MEKQLSNYALPRALELTGELLLSVFSRLDEGVLITDIEGIIIFYNRLHGMIDGLSPKQVLGKEITEVYNLKTQDSLAHRCIANGRPILQEYIMYKPRKGVKVNSINSVYPLWDKGVLVGCISFLKDYKVLKTLVVPDPLPPDPKFKKKTRYRFDDIKGSARTLLKAVTIARKAAQSVSSIMLYGETGTGKEMFAQSIHNAGHRQGASYVAINCASIPENLFEGLLFGTRKGAFTGAVDQKGLFEQANGGTLFLDEIDSMPIALQTKMLRAIQEQKIRRVGDLEEIPIDIRIISSTSVSPQKMLEASDRFRKDLFYRLAVVLIKIPPLRQREDDVSGLTKHFLGLLNRRLTRQVVSVSREVMALFYTYDWPGNIRELEHVIEGAMNQVERGTTLDVYHIAPYFATVNPLFLESQKRHITLADKAQAAPVSDILDRELEEAEKQRVEDILFDCRGRVKLAAQTLGISRQLLYYRMKKYNLDRKKIAGAAESKALETALNASGGNQTRTAEMLGISLQLLHYRMKKYGLKTPQVPGNKNSRNP